jgi:hypothetical protein
VRTTTKGFVAVALATLVLCSDSFGAVITAMVVLVLGLPAAGYWIGHWGALWVSTATLAGAFVSDVLWWNDVEPFTRKDVYEPLPALFPAIAVFLPLSALLLAAGVLARKRVARRHGATQGRVR